MKKDTEMIFLVLPINLKDLWNLIFYFEAVSFWEKIYEREFLSSSLLQSTTDIQLLLDFWSILSFVINYNFHIDNDYFLPAVGEGESVLIMIRRQPVLSNPDLI